MTFSRIGFEHEQEWKKKPTGVCLVMVGGLTQDLTLILSTKNTEQKKQRKENPSKNPSTTKEVERDSL